MPSQTLSHAARPTVAADASTTRPSPHVREAGAGPGVVCLHANASASGQWRDLMAELAAGFHVLAPDLFGAGGSPAWSGSRPLSLRDEAEFIEPVLAAAGSPLYLVGHSYGAAVALIAALANPGRVRAMALYEPTLFSLIDAEGPSPNAADGIRGVVAEVDAALDAGDLDGAAEAFIDYWLAAGAWRQTPASRKPAIAASMANAPHWGNALFREPTRLSAFESLDVPVLFMSGTRSTASALGVARLLTGALPRVRTLEFEDLGHMGPVTHPQVVNDAIARFFAAQA